MAETAACPPLADPETTRLLRELNDAGYWAEHLALAAGVRCVERRPMSG